VLDVLNQLYISSSTVLQKIDSLVLNLPPVSTPTEHKAYAAYQHLFQESGFLGYYHSAAAAAASSSSSSSSSSNSSSSSTQNAGSGPAADQPEKGAQDSRGKADMPQRHVVVGLTRIRS
jgi:hypothetical protein